MISKEKIAMVEGGKEISMIERRTRQQLRVYFKLRGWFYNEDYEEINS